MLDEYQEQKLAKKAGLVLSGLDEDGASNYIGDKQQWDRFEELKREMEENLCL